MTFSLVTHSAFFHGGVVMLLYEIIETEEGLTVAEVQPGIMPEEVATLQGGILIDPGPYKSFEDAYDAILALQEEEDEEGEKDQSLPP